MDVVPANPENWERDPFKLTVEGDKLYGRGTTDCLSHVSHCCRRARALPPRHPTLSPSQCVQW